MPNLARGCTRPWRRWRWDKGQGPRAQLDSSRHCPPLTLCKPHAERSTLCGNNHRGHERSMVKLKTTPSARQVPRSQIVLAPEASHPSVAPSLPPACSQEPKRAPAWPTGLKRAKGCRPASSFYSQRSTCRLQPQTRSVVLGDGPVSTVEVLSVAQSPCLLRSRTLILKTIRSPGPGLADVGFPGLLCLGATDTQAWGILCGRGSTGHCQTFSCIPGLYHQLDASSSPSTCNPQE